MLLPVLLTVGVVGALAFLSSKKDVPTDKGKVPAGSLPPYEPGRPGPGLPIPPGSISLPYQSPFEGTIPRSRYPGAGVMTLRSPCPPGQMWTRHDSAVSARVAPRPGEQWVYADYQPPTTYNPVTGAPMNYPVIQIKGRCVPEGS